MRYYTDKGLISKGATLNIQDVDGLYFMLVPVSDMPATKTAPETVEKTVLSDSTITQVEGLQSVDQKTYSFNYHRDNIAQLKKYAGKALSFLERNGDNTGEKFTGTFQFGRNDLSVNGIQQGSIFLTVNSADEFPVEDVRDIMKYTAIITTPIDDQEIAVSGKYELNIETSEGASIAVASDSDTIATASIADGKLTVNGVAKGNTMIRFTVTATGEATSYRTMAVTVK